MRASLPDYHSLRKTCLGGLISRNGSSICLFSIISASLTNWEVPGCKSKGKLPCELQWVNSRIEPANIFYFGKPSKMQYDTREPP